jgi:hypothetical protein
LVQREGMSLVGLGGVHAVACQGLAPGIVRGEERPIDGDGVRPRRLLKALGPPGAAGVVGDVLAELGQVVWARGLVPMRPQRSALAPQRRTTPQEVAGGAPRRRIDICRWPPSPAPQGGNRVGLARVVCGRAPWLACRERAWPSTQGLPACAPRSASPSPGKRPSAAPTRPAREGATAVRHGSGAAVLWRCSRMAPAGGTRPPDRLRAGRSMPP